MKKWALMHLVLTCLPSAGSAAWTQVWGDEFNYQGLPDPAVWTYEEGYIRNWESQYYMKEDPDNTRVENGALIIELHKQAMGGMEYTSGSISTQNSRNWQYGRFEARMKLPVSKSMWPAFWLMPQSWATGHSTWPASGEIDIMEGKGSNPSWTSGAIHFQNTDNNWQYRFNVFELMNGNFHDDWHVFAYEWTATEHRWYLDDQIFQRYTKADLATNPYPFDQPAHIKFDLALGGGFDGLPDSTTVTPMRFQVDYVRVYSGSQPTPSLTPPPYKHFSEGAADLGNGSMSFWMKPNTGSKFVNIMVRKNGAVIGYPMALTSGRFEATLTGFNPGDFVEWEYVYTGIDVWGAPDMQVETGYLWYAAYTGKTGINHPPANAKGNPGTDGGIIFDMRGRRIRKGRNVHQPLIPRGRTAAGVPGR